MKIERATRKNLDELVVLENNIEGGFFTRRNFRDFLRFPNFTVFMAYVDRKLAGYGVVLRRRTKSGRKGRIYSIGLLHKYRDVGHGRELLLLLEKSLLKDYGITYITLECHDSTGLINFYAKNGYEKIATLPAYYEDGNGIRMGKNL